MKRLILAATVMLITVVIFSCGKNECDSNCDAILPPIGFKVVNSAGQNLITGPNRTYSTKQVAVKSLVGNILFTDSIAFTGDTLLATTAISFTANAGVSQYYLYLNNVKTDSFQITYEAREGKTTCCPNYQAITALKINNIATTYTSPGNTTPVNVVK